MAFQVLRLKIEITPSSLMGSVILWIVFTVVGLAVISLPLLGAMIWGFFAVLLYWTSETLHQYGHFLAGRRVGYPMTGVRLWWVFGASIYPSDEPTLPAAIHIQRALGGAPVSIALGVVFGAVALLLKDSVAPFLEGLMALLAFLNLAYFGVGAFLPLGFTDGSTLLYYRNKP